MDEVEEKEESLRQCLSSDTVSFQLHLHLACAHRPSSNMYILYLTGIALTAHLVTDITVLSARPCKV